MDDGAGRHFFYLCPNKRLPQKSFFIFYGIVGKNNTLGFTPVNGDLLQLLVAIAVPLLLCAIAMHCVFKTAKGAPAFQATI
jgi:hypothetical protein